MTIEINNRPYDLPDDARISLLDFMRERLEFFGSKKGCNQGACGACTVLVDGERILSCLALAAQYDGRSVTTIEGVANGDELHPLQALFVEHEGMQCGYCTPGQIMSGIALKSELERGAPSNVSSDLTVAPRLSRDEIKERLSGNLCRCGAHNGIIDAVAAYVGGEEQ
ncbi:2Fe-2S iron-sulfur cluster-binding protein [Litoreibacter roseus]|uniref:(2Fe-2S)-binding protein n=1 Tax=Litoreibacter roseus TaxID=2601869 RepID=A0A6N6JEV1_9RHOB|nr:2Fe-2S iron-sulfur cluster-binding protein [Litoreibacter roseus]GFE63828.1 (2Fe-2S)-binding protein [Litoreibacter roseus]